MEIADIRALADIAHRHGIPLIADTTMIPFTQFSAKDLGVDIEVVSSTKYISGGATTIGGLVIDYGTVPNFGKRMRQEMLMNFGAYMSPHVAYMQTVGLETLDARYRVQAGNALAVAKAIKDIPEIKKVRYPGLPDDPFHDIARRQFGETYGEVLGNQEMETLVNDLFSCSNVNYTPDGKAILCILPQRDIEQLLN